jgi:hypothetical protein
MTDYNHDPVVPRVGPAANLAAATAHPNELLWTSDTFRLYVEQGGAKKLVGEADFVKISGALGTPASGTLTNCTGLPQASVVGLTTADGPTFDHIHATNGIQATGAEMLKIWTYTHTVTAGEIVAGTFNMAITAVTMAKIRSIVTTINDVTAGRCYSADEAYRNGLVAAHYLNSTTNFYFINAGSLAANDIVSLTIIEAV